MALKGDRHEARTDISFFMSEVVERGGIVVHNLGGTGAAMDSSKSTVGTPTGAGFSSTVSGSYPVGLLLNDMVNIDLTRQHLNMHRDEVQYGGKVRLLKQGFVVTNKISGTPTAGVPAYYNTAGNLTPTDPSAGAIWGEQQCVGRFLTAKDADGYAKVDINIKG